MNLNKVVIVLDHPDESRNIGAVCRAMANNDIKTLRIVGSKENYDIEHIHVLAIHAAYIFDNAEFFNSLTDAVKDCSLCAGTTRRRGKKRGKLLLPEEFAKEAADITDIEESDNKGSSGGKIALVFGNERTGLTDKELDECTMGVTIPSSDDFGSLNLSHAVQIMCYQLFRQKKGEIRGYRPIDLQRLSSTVNTISSSLQQIGFFKLAGRNDMEMFWRDILSRAKLSEGEAQYLEKTFTKMAGLAKKNASQTANAEKSSEKSKTKTEKSGDKK